MIEILPVVLYVLGSILLVVLIILGIKTISFLNKVEKTVDDINGKLDSLDGLFSIVDFTTDKIATITDTFVEYVTSMIRKLFVRNKKEEEIINE